mmetsp:Transcript_103128/g.300771  ORF Transcript_103128/g.300771 Transcript_103128/m.300771 type:complete len:201 (+) Transcript_103128:83-685(+)
MAAMEEDDWVVLPESSLDCLEEVAEEPAPHSISGGAAAATFCAPPQGSENEVVAEGEASPPDASEVLAAAAAGPTICSRAGLLELLARAGGEALNARDPTGWTVLHWAAFRGRAEVCTAILARPDFVLANALCRWSWGGTYTALQLAAAKGHAEACRAVLASKAFTKVDYARRGGKTALEMAREKGHQAAARVIAEAQAH